MTYHNLTKIKVVCERTINSDTAIVWSHIRIIIKVNTVCERPLTALMIPLLADDISETSPIAAFIKVNTVCKRHITVLVILQLAGHISQPSPKTIRLRRAINTLVIQQLSGHVSEPSPNSIRCVYKLKYSGDTAWSLIGAFTKVNMGYERPINVLMLL